MNTGVIIIMIYIRILIIGLILIFAGELLKQSEYRIFRLIGEVFSVISLPLVVFSPRIFLRHKNVAWSIIELMILLIYIGLNARKSNEDIFTVLEKVIVVVIFFIGSII